MVGRDGVVWKLMRLNWKDVKYNRGRWTDGTWVFGGLERGSSTCFLVPVPDRRSETLLEIRPGTTISPMSACWRAYDCLIACLPKDSYTLPLTTRTISLILLHGRTRKTLNKHGERFVVVFHDLADGKITWLATWQNLTSISRPSGTHTCFLPCNW